MLAGEVLGGRYKILGRIGEGGMAVVYKAECALLNRIVAIKVLRPQYASDEQFVERFRREARSAASLSHPNVVNIYDVGKDDDKYYIVMEYVKGESLKDIIRRRAPLPVPMACRIAAEICSALHHAHWNNVVHRDIKPHNILVTRDGRVKVMDFGIARAASTASLTETGTIVGTVSYFSPEQARGGLVAPQSDLYSLGVVLYEMVTGKVPFKGDSPIAIALQHIQDDPEPPRSIIPEIPEGLENIILKAMKKDTCERYKSAQEMLKDVSLYVDTGEESLGVSEDDEKDLPTLVIRKPLEDVVHNNAAYDNAARDNVAQDEAGGATVVREGNKVMKNRWLTVWLPLIIVGLMGFGFWASQAIPPLLFPEEVRVPDLVGKTIDEARLMAHDTRLRLDVTTRYDDRVEADRVILQKPEAGTAARSGSKLRIVVSMGKEMVEIPDLYGVSERQAAVTLEDTQLKAGIRTEDYSPDVESGLVMAQIPRAGDRVEAGTAVDIVISKGPKPETAVLPNFTGMTLGEVEMELASLGLARGRLIEDPSSPAGRGIVIAQYPLAGAEVELGTKVDLTISAGSGDQGGASVPMTKVLSINVPPGRDRQEVRAFVTDDYGRREVYRSTHESGERFNIEVKGYKISRIEVYVDGVLYMDYRV